MSDNVIKVFFSSVITALSYILGGFDVALQSLIVVIVIDYITGIIKSYKLKKLDSKVGFIGILKKICFLLLVAVAVVVDRIADTDGLIRNFVIYYLIANEGLSIIENLGQIGIPIPDKLRKALEQLKGENKEKDKEVKNEL